MFLKFLLISAVGRLIIYLIQQLPPVREMKNKFFGELLRCDLCLGVHLYFLLCGVFHFQVTSELFSVYIPVLSEYITGAILSAIMHYVSLGWKFKHSTWEVE